jgi:hypothetical protein
MLAIIDRSSIRAPKSCPPRSFASYRAISCASRIALADDLLVAVGLLLHRLDRNVPLPV